MMGCGSRKKGRRKRTKKKLAQGSEAAEAKTSTILMPRVPQKCFNCGASIHTEKVNWIGPDTIECPFCGQALAINFEKVV
ncbi:MAG: hypothetical protein ACXADC_15210 [Candidatus Thorarchaeota archaeon]|jgi:hypothetical protein